MSFLNNMYANRLNSNFNRHRMDAKIAPSRPKPACRPVDNYHYVIAEEKARIPIGMAQEMKEQSPVSVISAPIYQTSLVEKPQSSCSGSQLSLFDVQKPAALMSTGDKMKRSGSESGFYTDSDVASNVSFSA